MLSFRKLLAAEDGAAIIELALIAPVFALMTIGIVDMSNAYSRKLALEQGAQRAVEKIMQTTEDNTVEGTLTTEAVCQVNGQNADGTCKESPITAANVTVTYRLECTEGTSTTSQTSTDSIAFNLFECPTGASESRYISVHITDKYTPMFPIHFAGLDDDGTYHLSVTAGMRIQ